MTLDEAIKHCEEKADELKRKAAEDYFFGDIDWGEKVNCEECAKEHEQLAYWLKELKARREVDNAPTVERQYFPPCEDCHKKKDDDVSPCSNCQEFDCYGCKVKEADNDKKRGY